MYADETPILESVFADLAPDAVDIEDILTENMPLMQSCWYFDALTYRELSDWTDEMKAA